MSVCLFRLKNDIKHPFRTAALGGGSCVRLRDAAKSPAIASFCRHGRKQMVQTRFCWRGKKLCLTFTPFKINWKHYRVIYSGSHGKRVALESAGLTPRCNDLNRGRPSEQSAVHQNRTDTEHVVRWRLNPHCPFPTSTAAQGELQRPDVNIFSPTYLYSCVYSQSLQPECAQAGVSAHWYETVLFSFIVPIAI